MEIKRITGAYTGYGTTIATARKKTSAAASAKINTENNIDRVEFGFAAAITAAKAEIAGAVNANATPQEIVEAGKAAENFSRESLAALILMG